MYIKETAHSATIRRMLHQEGADVFDALDDVLYGGHKLLLDMISDFDLFDAYSVRMSDRGLWGVFDYGHWQTCGPLIGACRSRDLATVRLVLTMPGIHVNAVDSHGYTALHEICNDERMLSCLVQHPGVKVNVLDKN